MNSQSNPNPAIYTRWYIEKLGKIFRLEIQHICFTGFAAKFKITSYGLKYDHTEVIQDVPADEFLHHIKMGVVKPDWSETGSLVSEQYCILLNN